MNASWAAVFVALAGLVGVAVGRLWAGGRREGRVDAVLEQQADTNTRVITLIEDLDDRVRQLEHRPARRARR